MAAQESNVSMACNDVSLHNIDFVSPTDAENDILNSLNPEYIQYIEQRREEREFLNALTLRKNPTKVLELGTSSGASSVVLLNAIKNIPNSRLYSIDHSKSWYRESSKPSGFILDEYPILKEKWKLYTGSVASSYLNEIGGDIDLVFLDTAHGIPGEILDFIMVLPYLKDDALIIIHDTNLQTYHNNKFPHFRVNQFAPLLLMSGVRGRKILPEYNKEFFMSNQNHFDNDSLKTFPNVGAIQLNSKTRHNIWQLFNLLAMPWEYLPTDSDFKAIEEEIKEKYDTFYYNFFKKCVEWAKYSNALKEAAR